MQMAYWNANGIIHLVFLLLFTLVMPFSIQNCVSHGFEQLIPCFLLALVLICKLH